MIVAPWDGDGTSIDGVVHAPISDRCACLSLGDGEEEMDVGTIMLDRVHLDLSDPTGRAVAAWWLAEQDEDAVRAACEAHAGTSDARGFLDACCRGGDRSPAFVEALRRVVLAVAGLEVDRG